MIEERVCRGGSSSTVCDVDDPLLNWGPDISDPLLVYRNLARERGRVEIDQSFSNRNVVTLVLSELLYLQPGQFVNISDGSTEIKGLLLSCSLHRANTIEGLEIKTTLVIEVPYV